MHAHIYRVQACIWTGACERDGCADKCIVSRAATQSYFVMLDHASGPRFYGACSALAFIVNAYGVEGDGGRRRVLSDHVRSGRSHVSATCDHPRSGRSHTYHIRTLPHFLSSNTVSA